MITPAVSEQHLSSRSKSKVIYSSLSPSDETFLISSTRFRIYPMRTELRKDEHYIMFYSSWFWVIVTG